MKIKPASGQKGISLIETVIALGVLGFIGVGFLTAISTGSKATRLIDEKVMVENLVRDQLEGVKLAAYDTTEPIGYPVTVTPPTGYSVAIGVAVVDVGLQEITVTVSRGGSPFFTVKNYKVDR